MVFVDHVRITVRAGDGGRGCTAFSKPRYTRAPYPDGGNGGDGGDVVLRADPNIATLLDFRFRHEFRAGRGRHGSGNRKTGKRGSDCLVLVPPGTIIRDAASGDLLRDLVEAGEAVVIARGGRGGAGNGAARRATPGIPGETRELELELKLIADVGIVGAPNAGKSSLLARISTARPKVGAYPFTTRYPVLGVVDAAGRRPFVACDIPGLVEGAHAGRGLGTEFLRHVERTRLLVHLVDMAALDGTDPASVFRQVNEELRAYHGALEMRPQVVVANKMDLPEATGRLREFERAVRATASGATPRRRIWPISCATGAGIPELLRAIDQELSQMPEARAGTAR